MADDYTLPPNTCSPDDPVIERCDVYDSLGNWVTGFRATACNADWLCEAYEAMGWFGPNYPLVWYEDRPPAPPEPEPGPDSAP